MDHICHDQKSGLDPLIPQANLFPKTLDALYSLKFWWEKTMNFTPYLSFNGNCQEAMEFYTQLFGAQIDVPRRYSDEESCKDMPAETQDLVMYAKLSFGKTAWLMGSDVMGESYQLPQGVHVSVGFDTEEKAQEVFDGLAGDGKVVMPLAKTFFSEGFGMVRDRFGILWMVNVNQSESPYY